MKKLVVAVAVLSFFAGVVTPAHAQFIQRLSPLCINVVFNGDDTTMETNTKSFFDDLESRHLGVNCLSVNFFLAMNGMSGDNVFEDTTDTLTTNHIRFFVQSAKQKGYSVCLKPNISEKWLGGYKGLIKPGGNPFITPARDRWFASYGNLLKIYALLSEEEGVNCLVIGDELDSMDSSLRDTARWEGLIASIRQLYHGQLTYAMNWSPEYVVPSFASKLDAMCIDAFYDQQQLADSATVDQMYAAWKGIQPLLAWYHRQFNRPVWFCEVGTTPRVGSFRMPWDSNNGNPADYDAQRRYYAATCRFVRENGIRTYLWAVGFYDHMQNQYGRLTDNFFDTPSEDEVRKCNS